MILDTNVLVYAVGSAHPLREPCRRIVTAAQRGEVAATTSVLALQEFTYVYARRRSAAEAAALARGYLDLLDPVLPVAITDLRSALDLIEAVGLRPSDAVIAAQAIAARQVLVSADRAFAAVAQLTTVVPDDAGVDALLQR